MLTPQARGGLSAQVLGALRTGDVAPTLTRVRPDDDADAQITLWALYEQHYRGFDDADAALEWHPTLIALRGGLEEAFVADLRSRFVPPPAVGPFAESFFAYVAAFEGPSVATHVQRRADRGQVLELLRARSLYQLKEADPTTWAVPRLPARPQVALMALQFDEYGAGDPARQHARFFARGMEACRLDPTYGAYVDDAPVEVLAQNNAMSLFGLHRRWRGAAVGHLAAFEAASSLPSRQMAQGLRRLDLPEQIAAYYDEHVEADAVHEQLAVREICAPLVEQEPALLEDVFLGAFTCLDLEARTARVLLDAWAA
ncbi:MAG: iron-containing redox enzyme family protein [Nocardioides sp.]